MLCAPRLDIRTPIVHVNSVYTVVLRPRYVTNVHNMRHPFIWIVFFFFQTVISVSSNEQQCVCPFAHSPSFPLCTFCPSPYSCCWIKLNNSCGVEGTGLVWCCKFQQTTFYSSSSLSFSLRSCRRLVSLRLWPGGVSCVCMYVVYHPHVVLTLREFQYVLQHTKTSVMFSTVFVQ
jgi:hypothetical protein